MLMLSVFTALYCVICIFLFNYAVNKNHIKIKFSIFYICAAAGLIIRLYCGYSNIGHSTDMSCFSAWADMLYKNGFGEFYKSDVFTDYPPGYMYILRIVGMIKNSFDFTAGAEALIIKLPAIWCDILTAWIIYRIAEKDFLKETAQLLGAMYVLNPLTVLNSAVWGQVDSVYLVLIAAVMLLLTEKRLFFAYIIFGIAVLFKPQALIFSPVVIFASVEFLISCGRIKNSVFKLAVYMITAIGICILLCIPFGIKEVVLQYMNTLSSYPYATVNAFNLWGLLGMNWQETELGLSAAGYAFIGIICIVSGIIYFKTDDDSKYFSAASFLCFAVYMLSVRMHERYAFCSAALALLAFCLSPKRKHFMCFILLTVSQIVNIGWVYYIYETDASAYYQNAFINIASAVNVLILAYQAYFLIKKQDSRLFLPSEICVQERYEDKDRLKIGDIVSMLAVTVVYSVIALTNLGSVSAPKNGEELAAGESLKIEIEGSQNIAQFAFFMGEVPVDDNNLMKMEFFGGNGKLLKELVLDDCEVFSWHFGQTDVSGVKKIVITTEKNTVIKEMSVYDENIQKVTALSSSNTLFDEQDTVPKHEDWRNSAYFDEIYHARTAYEFANGLDVYEWTHPPLGKLFISLGVRLFGMNPFGWRIAGTVFGILMLPCIYLFARKIVKSSFISAVMMIAYAFDFMHFTQTRIATIDVYAAFFVILMYYFMYKYYTMSFYDTRLSKTFVPLFWSGICFGLGTACKWTGIYAGAGLCVIFFMTIHKRYKEYLITEDRRFFENAFKTILFCLLAFIIIPVIIYLTAYIPYIKCEGGGLVSVIKNQTDMFVYHSRTVADSTHPYSSKWYEWIIMKRPIWYYSGELENGLKEGISAFGNPIVWWGGVVSMLCMIYRAAVKKDKTAVFIVTGYLAQLLPWVFVQRPVFIYHYFPCVVFLVLSSGYCFRLLAGKDRRFLAVCVLYAVTAVMLFAVFYTVLAGTAVNPDFVDRFLRWFDTWVLI